MTESRVGTAPGRGVAPREETLRIGAERRASERVESVRSPYDGSEVGRVHLAGARDVDDAIAAAVRAAPGMRELPAHARARLLAGTARAIGERADELARLMAREGGKPLRFAQGEVARAVVTFELAAGEARRFGGEVVPIDLEPRAEGHLCFATRVPLGPVAAISPFNFPLNLVAHKLAPSFAIGAPVVLKPPPQAPLSSFALAQILEEAGLPPGALSVVPCDPDVAQRLVEDERMRVLSFTGSAEVGWKLQSLATKKRVLLELGGNAPCIVDEGADLEDALERITTGAWAQAGQVCIKVQRVLAHESIFEEFLGGFVARARAVRCGDPLDEETVVGPMIEERHVERVQDWIREAVDGGARLLCGGEVEGSVLRPAVLTGTRPDMKVVREEVFGPVTVVEPFRDFEEAIERCNDSRYGLQAGVFTRDLGRALAAWRGLAYGGITINEVPMFRIDSFPYGGTKDSGLGREGVRYAMEELSEHKVCVVRSP